MSFFSKIACFVWQTATTCGISIGTKKKMNIHNAGVKKKKIKKWQN